MLTQQHYYCTKKTELPSYSHTYKHTYLQIMLHSHHNIDSLASCLNNCYGSWNCCCWIIYAGRCDSEYFDFGCLAQEKKTFAIFRQFFFFRLFAKRNSLAISFCKHLKVTESLCKIASHSYFTLLCSL